MNLNLKQNINLINIYNLSKINVKINNPELIKMIEDNLKEYCQHEMEEDYIDISVDTCKKIYYCKKCLLTFNTR